MNTLVHTHDDDIQEVDYIQHEQSKDTQGAERVHLEMMTNILTVRYFLCTYKMVSCYGNGGKEKLSDSSVINPENYYCEKLLLYTPWRNERQDL